MLGQYRDSSVIPDILLVLRQGSHLSAPTIDHVTMDFRSHFLGTLSFQSNVECGRVCLATSCIKLFKALLDPSVIRSFNGYNPLKETYNAANNHLFIRTEVKATFERCSLLAYRYFTLKHATSAVNVSLLPCITVNLPRMLCQPPRLTSSLLVG